jgi:hypothetical protein
MPALAAAVAAVTPDNTPHGYNLTFAVPLGLFAVVAVAMYLMLGRPHRRIPARRGMMPAGQLGPPDPDAARAASIAGGLAVAAGGGSAESHLEAAGHIYGPGPGAAAADPDRAEAGAGDGTDAETGAGAGPPDGGDSSPAGDGDAGDTENGDSEAGP